MIKYRRPNQDSVFTSLDIRENVDQAFENAIRLGMKNSDDWMYMYSQGGYDYFKHYDTRQYCKYPQHGLRVIIAKIRSAIEVLHFCGK